MRAYGFDLGETLIGYNMPLNWKVHYRDGLLEIGKHCEQALRDGQLQKGVLILEKYNTRMNPRISEVPSDLIFREILDAWHWNLDIELAKSAFFSYFRRQTHAYGDALILLQALKSKGVQVGVLTDVPYGMDREYVVEDCKPIIEYIDVLVTSVDVGFRKPHDTGYLKLASSMGVNPGDMVFVGDEEKDIVGANKAGCFSVLIDRRSTSLSFGEKRKVSTLTDLAR